MDDLLYDRIGTDCLSLYQLLSLSEGAIYPGQVWRYQRAGQKP